MNGSSIEMHSTAPLLRYCVAFVFVCVCIKCVAKENAPSINNNKFYSERHSGFRRKNVMLISMYWQISHLAFFRFHSSSFRSNHMRNLYITRCVLYYSRTKTKWIISVRRVDIRRVILVIVAHTTRHLRWVCLCVFSMLRMRTLILM